MVAKYADHLPLYRQETIFGRAGLASRARRLVRGSAHAAYACNPWSTHAGAPSSLTAYCMPTRPRWQSLSPARARRMVPICGPTHQAAASVTNSLASAADSAVIESTQSLPRPSARGTTVDVPVQVIVPHKARAVIACPGCYELRANETVQDLARQLRHLGAAGASSHAAVQSHCREFRAGQVRFLERMNCRYSINWPSSSGLRLCSANVAIRP